ncbi:MAG: pyrimidine/purine nucleoside phosphorylase [Spirochaetaceae bacterium]
MLKSNEYFDGKVKSIGMKTEKGPATIGVMEKGEYEFSTTKNEIMDVISGRLKVKLQGKKEFNTILKGKSFKVNENTTFQVIAEVETAYICYYS